MTKAPCYLLAAMFIGQAVRVSPSFREESPGVFMAWLLLSLASAVVGGIWIALGWRAKP